MTDEERRLVRLLLERAWPTINDQGTIQFFGLGDGEYSVHDLMDGWDALMKRVGFVPPP